MPLASGLAKQTNETRLRWEQARDICLVAQGLARNANLGGKLQQGILILNQGQVSLIGHPTISRPAMKQDSLLAGEGPQLNSWGSLEFWYRR